MALFIRQDENRSELQKRLAVEIQNRSKEKAKKLADSPDGIEDSQYIEGTKQTTSLAGVWVAIFIIVAVLLIWLTVTSLSR